MNSKALPEIAPLYRIGQQARACLVDRDGYPAVRVELGPACLVVSHKDRRAEFGLFEFRKLVESVAWCFAHEWRSPRSDRKSWPGMSSWIQRQMMRGLMRPLHAAWRELLEKADSQVLAVQRAVWATTFSAAPVTLDERFYRESHLVADVLKYRAARIAVRHVQELGPRVIKTRINNSEEMRLLERLVQDCGMSMQLDLTPRGGLQIDAALDLLRDWIGLFSPTGRGYRSLNRTLMELPGGLSSAMVCNLATVCLPRPLTSRYELALALGYAECPNPCHWKTVLHASAAEVVQAIGRLKEHLLLPRSLRGNASFRCLANVLSRFPEQHHGGLVSLTEKAIRWDRQHAPLDEMPPETRTCRPSIPLPDLPGIRFLETVGEIVAEGERMSHCIAQYAANAVAGRSYLFHVDYEGSAASVEVDSCGRVVQAQGPRNSANPATTWGALALKKWGEGFSTVAQHLAADLTPPDSEDIPF